MKNKIHFSITEIKHLSVAMLAIAFAFSLILNKNEIFYSGKLTYSPWFFLSSLVAVGFAFIFHEMGHKFVAQKKGCWAEFRAWPAGIILAVALAVVSRGGFVFAAPGAVMISPAKRTRFGTAFTVLSSSDMGKISSAGVIINIIQAAIFSLLALFVNISIFPIAAQVNAWLAIFNLIPFGMLDGAKVLRWSPFIWLGLMAISVSLFGLIIFI